MPADLPVAAALAIAPSPIPAAQSGLLGAAKALTLLTNFAGQLATAFTAVGQPAVTTAQPATMPPAVAQPGLAQSAPVPAPTVTPATQADAAVNADTLAPPNPVVAIVVASDTGEAASPTHPGQPAKRAASTPSATVAPATVPQPANPTAQVVPFVTVPVQTTSPTNTQSTLSGTIAAPTTSQARPRSPASAAPRAEPLQHNAAEPVPLTGKAAAAQTATGPTLPLSLGHDTVTSQPGSTDTQAAPASMPTANLSPLIAELPQAAPSAPTETAQPVAAQPLQAAPSPTAQLAPALVSLAHAPDGTQRLTLRLDPPELGQVHVRIDRLPDAPARVDITVQRTETLTLLLRDQPQLQRALDQAGVQTDGRSITLHVAQAEPGPRPDAAPTFNPSTSLPGQAGGDGSHAAYRQATGQPQQDADTTEAAEPTLVPPSQASWLRVGVDITA